MNEHEEETAARKRARPKAQPQARPTSRQPTPVQPAAVDAAPLPGPVAVRDGANRLVLLAAVVSGVSSIRLCIKSRLDASARKKSIASIFTVGGMYCVAFAQILAGAWDGGISQTSFYPRNFA